jgi:ATP-dependent phosphofructokinase / diphosphate-dependent phosphofructokinase
MAGVTRIGLLTGGGDCPGLNAAIRAVVTRATGTHGVQVIGILDGWDGLMEGRMRPLDRDAVRGLLQRGGTVLGTSRRDPYVHGDGAGSLTPTLEREGIDALIVVGGDGTLRTADRLNAEGIPIVGVPKSIDNDIAGTDTTIGFDTAVQIATEAIDRITTTAESHDRVMVVEVMGRTQGWIATHAGMAAGADAILVPEEPYDLGEVAALVRSRAARGRRYSVVVVAEGVTPPPGSRVEARLDAFGFQRLGGVSTLVAAELEALTGFEARVTVLGHVQRGGVPSARDRVLATRFGIRAADVAARGRFGRMVALRGDTVTDVPLAECVIAPRSVPPDQYEAARIFFDSRTVPAASRGATRRSARTRR